jgi:hypothetical protein
MGSSGLTIRRSGTGFAPSGLWKGPRIVTLRYPLRFACPRRAPPGGGTSLFQFKAAVGRDFRQSRWSRIPSRPGLRRAISW